MCENTFFTLVANQEISTTMSSHRLYDFVTSVNLDRSGVPSDFNALVEILRILVAYDTGTSHNPALYKSNVELISALNTTLQALGAKTFIKSEEYPKGTPQQTLVARIGPDVEGGVVLCAHTDVVPATNQTGWNTPPFQLTEKDKILVDRGTSDMKAAIAEYLAIADVLQKKSEQLKKPVYLAFTWGEEIGKGNTSVVELLKEVGAKPEVILVGEPTDGKLIVGHKGATTLKVSFIGKAGHSSYPEKGVSATKYAAKLVTFIEELLNKFRQDARYHHADFDPPYPIINNGIIEGGVGGNVIAGSALVTLHARPLPTPHFFENEILRPINAEIMRLDALMKEEARRVELATKSSTPIKVGVTLNQPSFLPGLPSQKQDARLEGMVNLYKKTMGIAPEIDVLETASYATDAGGIAQGLSEHNKPLVIIYGPGGITQGAHAPNEWLSKDQFLHSSKYPMAVIRGICQNQEMVKSPKGSASIQSVSQLEQTGCLR